MKIICGTQSKSCTVERVNLTIFRHFPAHPCLESVRLRVVIYVEVVQGGPKRMQQIFNLKKLGFFFRSIFLRFCMEVPMISNIIYVKSKNSPADGNPDL